MRYPVWPLTGFVKIGVFSDKSLLCQNFKGRHEFTYSINFNDEILIKISKYASFELVKLRVALLDISDSMIKTNYWNLAQSISWTGDRIDCVKLKINRLWEFEGKLTAKTVQIWRKIDCEITNRCWKTIQKMKRSGKTNRAEPTDLSWIDKFLGCVELFENV